MNPKSQFTSFAQLKCEKGPGAVLSSAAKELARQGRSSFNLELGAGFSSGSAGPWRFAAAMRWPRGRDRTAPTRAVAGVLREGLRIYLKRTGVGRFAMEQVSGGAGLHMARLGWR